MFGLKVELMACGGMVDGTREQSWFFPDLVLLYQLHETLTNCLHHISSVPQPFLLLIAVNLAQARFLGWRWILWPVLTWLAVQRSKAVVFLTLYECINYMKKFQPVSITPQTCNSHFCCWLLHFQPKNPAWAKLAAINNKNGCGTAEIWCRKFGSISYIWY